MKVLAVIVNVFFPGIGTLFVRKYGQAIAQILFGLLATVLIVTGIGVIIGGPLAVIVWIWAIASAVTAKT